jgi:hypothetical protein
MVESGKVYDIDQWGNKTGKGRLIIEGSYSMIELIAIFNRTAIF